MASLYFDKSRRGYRVAFRLRGARRALWLGRVSKAAARSIAGHLEALVLAAETATLPPESARRWVALVGPRIRNRLAAWGLVSAVAAATKLPGTLGGWSRHYIETRTDWADRTRYRMENARRHLIAQLGTDTALAAITPGQAEEYARWVRSHFKASHAGKLVADARQFFRAAEKYRILADNPFAGLDSSQAVDETRKRYITPETAAELMAAADPYLAALIALARFGGLRIPSEALSLEWHRVDWTRDRFTIYSPKTKTVRTLPLFPEIRPYLEALYDTAPQGGQFAFSRYRSTAAKVYRGWLLALLDRTGVPPWPDLWRNLRFSAKNDLLKRFPEHVVCAWIGHDRETGRKHYDRATEADYAAAVVRPVVRASHPAPPRAANET